MLLKKVDVVFHKGVFYALKRGNKITKRWTCCVHRSQAFWKI